MYTIIFDTETTGLPKKRSATLDDNENWPYIVQFSWILCDMDTGEIHIRDYIIQLPAGMLIPPAATNIHGITNEMMREKGISCKEALDAFQQDLEKSQYVVAHNLNFDKTIIRVELYRHNMQNIFKLQNYIYFCTMKYGTYFCDLVKINRWNGRLETKPPKLIELYEKMFEETPTNLHNSLVDVFVCFRCFYKMLRATDVFKDKPSIETKFRALM